MKSIPLFFIDSSALMEMFNGENKDKSQELLQKMKEIKDRGADLKAVTTLSNFLRAIWLANPDVKINQIQKTLSFLEVGFSVADFKDGDAVMKETIHLVELISKIQTIKEGKNGDALQS